MAPERGQIFLFFLNWYFYTYVPKIFTTNVKVQQKHIYQDAVRGLHLLFGNSDLTLVINLILRRKTPLNLGISIKADLRRERLASQTRQRGSYSHLNKPQKTIFEFSIIFQISKSNY